MDDSNNEAPVGLRDLIAIKAMEAFLRPDVRPDFLYALFNTTSISTAAYAMADSMLEAREA